MINKIYPITASYCDNGQQKIFHFRPRLSFVEYGAAVESVVRSLYIDGAYKPYLKQYLLCSVIIENYTDYSGGVGPDEILDLCENTDFFTTITSVIDSKQLESLYRDVDELIEYNNTCVPWIGAAQEIRKLSAALQNSCCKANEEGSQ